MRVSRQLSLRNVPTSTNMNSQFSEVRFSSVALAVELVSSCLKVLMVKKLADCVVECVLLGAKHGDEKHPTSSSLQKFDNEIARYVRIGKGKRAWY